MNAIVNVKELMRGVLRDWFSKEVMDDAFPYVMWAVEANEPRRITLVYEVRPVGPNFTLKCIEHYSENIA